MSRRLATCRECGKPVVFATVSNKTGKRPSLMPLNPDPDPDGNVVAYKDGAGRLVARVVGKDGQCLGYERRMMPHFATCEKRDTSLTSGAKTGTPASVTSLDAWRKAIAARGRAARNRRGRRPAPPITGIRWRP